jgi:AcrR family transcriptional regulator
MPRVSRIQSTPQRPQQRVRPVQERARRKIDAILDATAFLLQKHGVEAVSTTAIAEQAGIPPATVYHYFDNRLAVFAALAKRIIADVDAGLTEVLVEQLMAPVPDWRAVLEGLFTAYAQAPGYVAVLGALRAEPALQELVHESNQRIADVLAGMLAQRTSLPLERSSRIAWIMSECAETVLQAALMADEAEAAALLDELGTIVECLFAHYAT